jgi:hypothetical protein
MLRILLAQTENPPVAWGNALNQRSTNAARFALKAVALAAGCLWGSPAAALGLGRLSGAVGAGRNARAEIDVTSITAEEASSLKLRVAPPEAYRAPASNTTPRWRAPRCRWCAVPTAGRAARDQ